MHSDDRRTVTIRPMAHADREALAALVVSIENFNQAEIDCALELIDIYLNDQTQDDYRVVLAEDSHARVHAYACWGPTPLTRGTHDLYWIATHPDARGRGIGRALMNHVEEQAQKNGGRLLVVETSSKSSYARTIEFYRRIGYEESSRIADFYDIGDDKLTFVKRLT